MIPAQFDFGSKSSIMFGSDFLLVSAKNGEVLCQKVSTQAACMQSNEPLLLFSKLLGI